MTDVCLIEALSILPDGVLINTISAANNINILISFIGKEKG